MTELLYLGDYSCRLTSKNNTVLYINPGKGKDYSRQADIILQTTKANHWYNFISQRIKRKSSTKIYSR